MAATPSHRSTSSASSTPEAIVRGAEAEESPVILQLSQNAVRYHFGRLEPIGAACRELAAAAAVPVALHLDHATDTGLCERAVAVGFGSVMLDAPGAADEAASAVADLVAWTEPRGVAVEGALGVVGGKDGQVTSHDGMTEPGAARDYVAATGVAALAVAIGTTHGMVERRPGSTSTDSPRCGRRCRSRWCCTARRACRTTSSWPRPGSASPR
jgi:fructose-bisphosphate aldolase class II